MIIRRPKIAIVIPVYNEEKTLEQCILEAKKAIEASPYQAEIVISDNNSSDASVSIAKRLGATVLHNPKRGYGANLHFGITNSDADIVFFADADGSYPFEEFERFVQPIVDDPQGTPFVLGNRFSPAMEKGAMPLLNKYLGTPVLTFFINWIFGAKIRDCNCGMRAISVNAYHQLKMRSSGMEYASEMIIKAIKNRVPILNVTFDFRKDRRGSPPHLNRWVDGWRHLRFILSNADNNYVLGVPFGFSIVSALICFVCSFFPAFNLSYPLHTTLAFIIFTIVSSTVALSFFSVRMGLFLIEDLNCRIVRKAVELEKQTSFIKIALLTIVVGSLEFFFVLYQWYKMDFGVINEYSVIIRAALWYVLAANLLYLDILVSTFVNIRNSFKEAS